MDHREGAWAELRLPVENRTAAADQLNLNLSSRTTMLLEILMVLMCLGAVTGNILVIVIVAATKTFHSVTSVLIINLAISDLLVGVGVMPFVAISIMNKSWVDFTDLCLYVGYTTSVYCSASVLTLAAIALDRYRSIVDSLRYSARCTLCRTCSVVLWIWLQALLTSCPPLLGWSNVDYVMPMFSCAVSWSSSPSYTVFMAFISFVIPAVVILFCYVKIVRVARSHARRIHTLEDHLQRNRRGNSYPTSSSSSSDPLSKDSSSQQHPLRWVDHVPSTGRPVYHLSGSVVSEVHGDRAPSDPGLPDPAASEADPASLAGPQTSSYSPTAPQGVATRPTAFGAAPSHPAASQDPLTPQAFSPPPSNPAAARTAPHLPPNRPPHHHHHPHNSHQGVVRLFLVIFAFLLCWAPYVGVALVQATEAALSIQTSLVSPSFITFSYWLALLNSDINPLLYALLSKRFQGALLSLRQKVMARLGRAVGRGGVEARGGEEEEGRRSTTTCCTLTHTATPSSCPDPGGNPGQSSYCSSIFTLNSCYSGPREGLCGVFLPGSTSSSSSSCAVWQEARGEGSTRRLECLQVPSRTPEGSRLPFSAATTERQATFFYGQITVRVEHDVC